MIIINNLKVAIHNTANVGLVQHTLQAIWGFGLMEKLVLYLEDLANPNNGLNLVPNPL